MTGKVVLFGDGQIAESAYWQLTHNSAYTVAGFTVDGAHQLRQRLFDLPVTPFEGVEARFPPDEYAMLVSISYRDANRLRAEKYAQAKGKGYRLICYVSSRASVWPGLEMGDNIYIRGRAELEPFTRLGNDVVIGAAATIGHHTVIGDHCYVAARAAVAGSVTVEPYCLLGANCTIRDGVRIAAGGIIGAGAVILEDTEAGGVYKANPARKLGITSERLTRI